MRSTPRDLGMPEARPFFYGYWADGTIGTLGVFTPLPIVTAVYKQKGMTITGGGCKVPISGLYHVGGMIRTDNATAATANFSEFCLLVNNVMTVRTVTPNSFISAKLVQYAYHTLWEPMPLNSGDIVTVQLYSGTGTLTYYGGATWPGSGLRILYNSLVVTQ